MRPSPIQKEVLKQINKDENKHKIKVLQALLKGLNAHSMFKDWILMKFSLSAEAMNLQILPKLKRQLKNAIRELEREQAEKSDEREFGKAVFRQLFSLPGNYTFEDQLFDEVKLVSYKNFLDSSLMHSQVNKKQTKNFYRANHLVLKEYFFNNWLPPEAIKRYFKYITKKDINDIDHFLQSDKNETILPIKVDF